jgi:hypothetical protein
VVDSVQTHRPSLPSAVGPRAMVRSSRLPGSTRVSRMFVWMTVRFPARRGSPFVRPRDPDRYFLESSLELLPERLSSGGLDGS